MIGNLLVLLLVTASPDAGDDRPVLTVESLYADCPAAPPPIAVDGGYFTPELRARRTVCQLAALENYAAPKLAEESGKPASPGFVVGIALGATGLFIGGILIGALVLPPRH